MAKTDANTALQGITGGVDRWVYRRYGNEVVISKRPKRTAPPSEAQMAVHERFRQAADYARVAKQNPELLAVYQAVAEAKGISVFIAMMTDYLRPPAVNAIDLRGYQRRIGDRILIRASKDAGVTTVNVAIRDSALAVLEEGAAVLEQGLWVYTATTEIPAAAGITITATAVDRPGNTGTKTQPLA